MLKVVTTVSGEMEADSLCGRLTAAGVQATPQQGVGGPAWGPPSARYVYVEEQDLDRARQILNVLDGRSDAELADERASAAATMPRA